MIETNKIVQARFCTLLAHLCVLMTLLWDINKCVRICLPNPYHEPFHQLHRARLSAGLMASVVAIFVESTTFLYGTMHMKGICLCSIVMHSFAVIMLTHLSLSGNVCDWYWSIFVSSSLTTTVADLFVAFRNLWNSGFISSAMTLVGATIKHVANEHQHLTQTHDYKPGWSFYLILAGVVTTLGSSLPVGFNIGVVNTPAELIKNFCNQSFASRYDLILDETWLNVLWSAVVSIFIVGGCTGSILGSVLADKLGRKKATIVTNVLSLAGAVLFFFCRAANSVEMLIIGRLLVGLAGGLTTSIVPMYLTELAPPSLTGAMGVACPMGVNVGVLVGQVMGLESLLGRDEDWPFLLSVYALLVIICLPILFILPESPKYLFVVRRNEIAAICELSRLRGASSSVLTEDLDMLKEESRNEASSAGEHWSMLRVLREPRLRLPLLLACSMQAGQQTSGINAVFYYSQTIFQQAGLSQLQAQYATICSGFINVCTAVLMLYLLPRTGRRPLLLGSVLVASIILATLAVAMNFINAVSWMPHVCMLAVLAYVLVYGFGLGPIPYFIASEIFEVSPRPAGMAWGSLANWGGNFLVGMCFPTMRTVIGPYSFLVFAVITFGLFIFQKLYFPETRGKTPSQVTQLCSRGLKSRPLEAAPIDNL